MLGVAVKIVRYADDSQPGWVECHLIDVHGRPWSFIEKVPVVTTKTLDAATIFPQSGIIACEVIGQATGVARIDTARPWGVESVEGQTQFEVPEGALVEW